MEPRPEHPTSAVRVSTHGHTRQSSRSSSARGCRLCPRSLASTRLAPSHCDRLGLHDSPSEEPCFLRRSPATDLSAVALAKLAFTPGRAFFERPPNVIEPGECRSVPGLAGTQHGSRPRSEGSCWRFPPARVPSFEIEPRTPRVVPRSLARLGVSLRTERRMPWRAWVPSRLPRP